MSKFGKKLLIFFFVFFAITTTVFTSCSIKSKKTKVENTPEINWELTEKFRTITSEIDWSEIDESNKLHKDDNKASFENGSVSYGTFFLSPIQYKKTVPLAPNQKFKISYDHHLTCFDIDAVNGYGVYDKNDVFIDSKNAIIYFFKNFEIVRAFKMKSVDDLFVYTWSLNNHLSIHCENYRLLKREYFDNMKHYNDTEYILNVEIMNTP